MKKQRQRRALERLRLQLSKGTKPVKIDGKTTTATMPLTEADKARITKEINKLESSNL